MRTAKKQRTSLWTFPINSAPEAGTRCRTTPLLRERALGYELGLRAEGDPAVSTSDGHPLSIFLQHQ